MRDLRSGGAALHFSGLPAGPGTMKFAQTADTGWRPVLFRRHLLYESELSTEMPSKQRCRTVTCGISYLSKVLCGEDEIRTRGTE
jgi:hypothetical protein